MYQIKTLNKISKNGLDRFNANYNCADEIDAPDAILVRSASMHEMEMPESLLAIARAGAGAASTVIMMMVPIIVFIITQSNIIETMGSSGMKD